MPRKSNNNNSKPLFDLNNLEKAKAIMENIYQIAKKGTAFTSNKKDVQEYIDNLEKMKSLYEQLGKYYTGKKNLNEYSKAEDYKKEMEYLADILKMQESSLEQKKQEAVIIERARQKEKEKQELEKNREKITRNINKLTEYSNELKEKQLKLVKKQAEEEYDNMTRKQKAEVGDKDTYVASRTNTYNRILTSRASNALSNAVNNAVKTGESFNKSDVDSIMSQVISGIVDKADVNDFNDGTKKFIEGAEKLDIGGIALSAASKGIKDAANAAFDTMLRIFKSGINKQSQIYEDTFKNMSVRTGISRSDYYSRQMGLNNELSSLGLRNNISTADVQQMWNSLADIGMNERDMFESALDNVITKNIVPYLDTTSQSFNLLNNRLDGNFVKQIRGINQASLDIAGNNYATQNILNQLIDEVQPMSDKAIEDLAKGSTELASYANFLMSEEGGNLSESQADEIISMIYKQQKYSDQIMSSGSTFERLAFLNNVQDGTNIYNPNEYNNAIGNIIDAGQFLSRGPGYGSTMGGLIQNISNTAFFGSGSYNLANSFRKISESGKSGTDIANITDISDESFQKYISEVENNFKNDKNQTNKQLQNITLENLMNELSVAKEWMGEYTDVLVSAINGIGSALITGLTTSALGKGIIEALGSGGAGGTLLSALGKAGPIALGIGVVGATVYGLHKWDQYIMKKQTDDDKSYADRSNELYSNYTSAAEAQATENGQDKSSINYDQLWADAINDTQSRGNIGILKNSGEVGLIEQANGIFSTNTSDDFGLLAAFTGLDKDTRQKLGLTPSAMQTGAAEAKMALNTMYSGKSFKEYNAIKLFALRSLMNNNSDILKASDLYAALNIAYQMNGLSNDKSIIEPLKEYFGWDLLSSKDNINKYLENTGITQASQLSRIYKLLSSKDIDFYLSSSSGKFSGYPTEEELKKNYNLHRYGLNEVPYDNYPALLHEGEAVLTASTANEMRTLVEEYRDTKNQNANFDIIIQSQTASLVQKLDEVIAAINSNGGGVSTSNNTINNNYSNTLSSYNQKVRNTRRNNMLHIRSPKSFIQS